MVEKEQSNYLEELVKLMSKIVDQNNILIEDKNSKQDYIIKLLEALVEGMEEDEYQDEDVDSMYRTLD